MRFPSPLCRQVSADVGPSSSCFTLMFRSALFTKARGSLTSGGVIEFTQTDLSVI